MPLDRADILFGKLAIGRSYVSRGDALQIAEVVDTSSRTGRHETFSSAAIRLGYLQPARVEELLAVLEHGTLICRGSCDAHYRLSTLSPEQTVACQRCHGPLYVSRDPLPVGTAPTAADAEDVKDGSTTFLELDTPKGLHEVEPEVSFDEGDEGDESPDEAGHTFLDLDLDMPDDGGGGFPPPPAPEVPHAGGAPESGEGTLEIDGEATYQMDVDSGLLFEPFPIGEIEVLAPIGEGGMGAVYRGRKAGRILAIKVLHQRAEHNRDVLARFAREVRLTASLDHPNIVRVYETGIVPGGRLEGQPYFTMDCIQGHDLTGWVAEQPRASSECASLVALIALAMNYAHGRGIVHRDLKPQNILVERETERPLICDFGLARYRADMQQLTRTGDILGTPSYMPPEQALGDRKKIGPPTDVYALGAICYYLLTGRPPFSGPSAFATISKVVREPPRSPSAFNPEVPPALERVVLKALAKQPTDRFHTCGELAAALSL